MLLLSSEDVHTRNNKSFLHRRSASVSVYLTYYLAAALVEKKIANSGYFLQYVTNEGVVLPHGDCKWGPGEGGLIFEGKCIFENKPPPQSRSYLQLKKGRGLFSGGHGSIFS